MDWEMRAASLILCLGILLATIQNGIAERKIICYYTNWSVYRPGTAKFSPQNINPYLCTHLIYAFGGFTKENALKPFDKYQDIEKGGYAKFTGLKTYNKNLKTMLAIGGWNEGSSRFSPMVADPARRREFVKNAVKFLRQNHFDGLDLDWEYPTFRDGGKPRDKDNYANLVQELYEEFERESSKTGRPRLLLSMAVPAGIEYIDKGYDVPRLNEYLDFINLLSYDYHSAYEPAVNHHSPLYPLEEDNEYNYDAELTIDYTINHLLEKGASADKIILGIPTYGRSYTLFNQEATDLGSPADGPGVEGKATREKGYLAYYEICENLAESDEWEVVQPNPKAMGPYAFKGNQWVGYDDEDVVKLKARYVNEKKLGGIMFWSIDNDDFRGKCHGRPYPLIEAAKETLLRDNSRNIENTKSVDNRKKTRTQGVQSNARKFGTNSQRSSTTSAPITNRRVSSSRPKNRNISKSKTSVDEDDREVSRRSYDPSSDIEDAEGRNTVRVTEKTERPKNRNRSKTRNSSTDHNSRRKQSRRKDQSKTDKDEGSLSNKLTTPEPPTTPDPGSDFKCEDEGFFPHPRDCKKYFWCLDSGPSGLGVVAHQFTCPSGLVFNKAADSCDYPRNVICPKTSKTSVVSTTRSPITAATSRTTYLHSTTTAKAEEPEEYDSEEDYEDEDEDEEPEEEDVREEPKTTTTTKPLVYKTLTRNRPSTTTTTTTTTAPSEPEREIGGEDEEEDPRVIKELIDLIKKAGGIEQLEKQLLLQEKNSDSRSDSESVTPAAISRSLYERVLNRQTNRFGNGQRPVLSPSENSYVNGPGRAQFEGLDDIPEVKSLRRSQKPQYVTIERPKSSATKESENEEIDENEEDDDNTDVASSEEESISNPLEEKSATQRVTPNYVNIRRTRPSTTTSKIENDVEEKEAEVEKEKPTRRRRPYISKQQNNEASFDTTKSSRNQGSDFRNSEKKGVDLSTTERNDGSPTIDSRYSNVQRFRGTTLKPLENLSSLSSYEITTSPTKLEEDSEVQPRSTTSTTTTSSTTPTTTTTSTSTEIFTVISLEPSKTSSSVSPKVDNTDSTPEAAKLVEDSVTEILFTTLPATTSSTTTTRTTIGHSSRSTIATVSQPRPFGFSRRRFSTSEATTTTTTSAPPSSRSKVSIASRNSTRPSSPFLGRVRSRTKSVDRIVEDEPVEASTSRSKEPSRSRGRGSSRYTPPTSRVRTEDGSTNFVPNPRYRERGRTTTSTTSSPISIGDTKRKLRRPSRVSTESTKTNELDDSPIVKITQSRRRNTSLRSRTESNDEENDKITNIKVFKRPTVNRELYDRTKQTKKRNNVQEPVQNTNIESYQKSDKSESDKNDSTNIVDQEVTLVDSLVESNTIEPIYFNRAKSIELTDITTPSNNKVDYTSNRPDDSIATTTAHIEAHEFNPKLVIIVTEHAESTTEAPKRRKVILRKRPTSSSSAVDTVEIEEEERSDAVRRQKVIKRKRPLQDTSSTEVSLEEEDSSLLPESMTSIADKDVEKSTIVTDRTEITSINAEELPVVIGFTRKMQDSTLPVTESTDYNFDDFTKIILETLAAKTTTISNEETTDSISTIDAYADEEYPSTREMNVEATTMESTLATATQDNTESGVFLEETLLPGSKKLSTQITTSGLFTTESNSPLRSNLEARYARKKFIRKNPAASGINSTSGRYPLVSSSTESISHEILSRRRNHLFTRRHPISSTTTNILRDDLQNQEEKKDANNRSRDLIGQEVAEDTTLKNNSANALSDDFAKFWKSYTTVSSSDQTSNSSSIEDIDDINKEPEDATTYQSPITTSKSEIRPRYKIPVILKRPFDPEEALSPKRYQPLDSAPEESEETPETKEAKLKQSYLRQPRTRYKLQNRDNVNKINEETTTSSPEPTSTWQYVRTRLYSKRPTSTSTEASVTETLIPAKKFDYVADALHRKQQSLKTTTPRSNDPFDSQNLVDLDHRTAKPVTRLVTSVTESGTTERQKILIKTKYSSLTSTTRIPADQFSPSLVTKFDDEAINEIRQGIEHSTLPIEGEFNSHRYDGRFTTESQEPSTIEIESVADSKTRLPTLKELIGYPTTYYDDRISTTPSSTFFLRNDVDNDISQQNVEETFVQGTNEDEEREQSIRDIIGEETGDSWLRQASKDKARSRTLNRMDEEPILVTNAIQEEAKKTSSTLMYMKPTTMRGIPLDSLTSSPRGFYITRSDDLSSSTFAGDFTSSYTTIGSSVERQTETDLISTTDETVAYINQNDIETDEIVTVTRNYQKELELAIFNNVNDIIKSKDVDNREEKSSTFNSLENSDSTENPLIYKEPDTVTIPVSRPTSKREKLLRNFNHNTTPSSNVYAFSPTRSTGRRFILGVVRQPHYNEANIPLWTGKRIVARKRNRTVSKEVERRIDEDVSYTTMNIFENASTLTLAKPKLTPISTTPTIPSIVSKSTSSKILDVNSYSIGNEEGAITLINSIIAATPSVFKISSVTSDLTTTIISTISDNFTSVTEIPSTANEAIITTTPSSTDAVVKAPMIANDQATIAIEFAIKSAGIEFPVSTTANYSTDDVPTTASTHAIANDSVIIPVTTSIGVEITSPNANHSTDFANMVVPATASAEVQITSPITNYSVTMPTNTNAIPTDSAPVITISAGNNIISTDSVVAIDSTITMSAATSTEVETSTITNNPLLVIPATTIPSTNTSSSTIISSTHATISATTSNLLDTVTVRNMLTTITTPAAVILPTINDSNVITSAYVNGSSNFAITDTLTTLNQPRSSSVISSKDFVTSTRSTVPTTLIESTTTHFNSSDFNISDNSKVSVTTAKSIQTTEIPTTFETSPIFTSTVISRSLPSTNSAISSQMRPIITQTPSTLFSIVTSINDNTATVEKSTNDESIAMSISQTTDIYEPSSVQTTSEKSTTSRRKVIFKEGASRAINRKQDQALKVDDQINQKTSRHRVVNRKNNWLGRPVVHQTINRNPLHRVTLHRGEPRRPPGFTSRVVEQNHRRRITQKRTRVNFQPIDTTIRPEDVVQNSTEAHNRGRSVRRRIVSKRIREKVEKETTTLEAMPLLSQSTENETLHRNFKEARADPDFVDTTFQGNFSINFYVNRNFSNKEKKARRMRVLLKSIRPKSEENNSTTEKISTDIIEGNIQNNISTNLTTSTSKNLADERKTKRRMRIVRKKIRPKFEEEEAKTEKTNTDSDSTDESLRGAFSNNFRRGKNFPGDYKPRRRLRVVLKSIKPKSEEGNSTTKGTSNVNLFDEEETRKSQFASEEKDSVAEETIAHSDFTDKVFSSNLHVDDKLPDREKMMEDTEKPQTTETFVLVKEDTDQPSLEVNSLRNGGSIGRTTGYSTRYRKPTQSTTNVPLINTFPSTVAIYRKGRPIETTFSSRIDLIDAYENSGSTAIQNDQKAEVSDQSIRAQEFAVTLTNPPLSSSDTGRTLLRDAARRKISTTVAPRTDPAIDRTVISRPRFDDDSRNRQRPKTKNAPIVNSTTRPRRPPVLDYDYYEDETPIVIGKPVLNSKLFLTSKGTIRCLDQGNFPHPYSCKKFITCARMVNGQVIGTEYTCPDRLTFDPIGGICNWSAGLGCKV
ncbi:mucin-5AC-like [Nylanderia fulva]|uniref:mucin-5AC-like n=1 Tax=Nylanderia fulva TaxID=613905 RepID=UPI0010FBA5FF|nr:mucin-5AC-like [Nylanderia fulva]